MNELPRLFLGWSQDLGSERRSNEFDELRFDVFAELRVGPVECENLFVVGDWCGRGTDS